MQVSKLNIIKSSFLSQKYALEDKIFKHFPAEIKRLTERIDGYAADIATAKANKPTDKDAFTMTIADTVYTDRKAAGSAILAECQAMQSPDPVPLGSYRGFDMMVSFDSYEKEYRVALKDTFTHNVNLGTDIFGNITRLDNALDSMEPKMHTAIEKLETVKSQLETAKVEVNNPFPQEVELTEKSGRLNEINIALNLDKKENELVEAAPDESDNAEQPQRKERDYER
jgi:hypothetical protein